MTSPHLGRTARYLAQYWRNAYQIRARGLTLEQITSGKVTDLIVFSKWQEKTWGIDYSANHALAISQIVSRNTEEISRIKRQIADEDLSQEEMKNLYDRAQELYYESSAASDLMEALSG